MKKITYILSLLLFFGFSVSATQATEVETKYSISGWERASIGSDIITLIPGGVTLESGPKTGGWYQVEYNGKNMWVMAWQVEPVTYADEEVFATYQFNSRVRSGAGTEYDILHTFNVNTQVEILEEKDDWYYVTDGTYKGWSASWLLLKSQKEDEIIETSKDTIVDSQVGLVPSGIDLEALEEYWTDKVNTLRAKRGLSQLVIDKRFTNTAKEYAGYMGKTGATNHQRADGSSMHDWIDEKLAGEFTDRYSNGGWKANYFTENIAWGYAEGSTESVKNILDDAMDFYLSEASYNGPHYRTTYHEDWNTIGVGFYFEPMSKEGRYKVYEVFHYGSLK